MRLRQAHAILETTTALQAMGLEFELHPLHDDRMHGFTEFTDPDMDGFNARPYIINILPGPDDDTIEVYLTFGWGPDPESLLYSKYSVALEGSEGEERFRGLVGARIAERVAEAVREHERPFRAAYEERARLDQLAAEEVTNPSPVWAPVTRHVCRPPFMARTLECDCSRCCAAAPHETGCTQPDTPECSCPADAEYHLNDCPEYEGESMPAEFTPEEIRLCHEAMEFDHHCRVCTAEDDRPAEAVPGTDF